MKVKTYEQSIEALEQILLKLREGDIPVDEMTASMTEANALIALCREKILLTEEELKNLNIEKV